MPEKKPKLEFLSNVPVIAVLGKNFWSGNTQYGKSFGWNVTVGGRDYTMFASEILHDKIKGFPQGTKVKIIYAERKGEGGKPYHEWEVSAGNGQPAQAKPSPAPGAVENVPDRDSYRTARMDKVIEALEDAYRIAGNFNLGLTKDELDMRLDHADIRAIAISLVIAEDRGL